MKQKLFTTATLAMMTTVFMAAAGIPSGNADAPGPRRLLEVKGYPTPQAKLKMRNPAPQRVNAADFNNRTFKGSLISADSWASLSIGEVPYGVYDFRIGSDGLASTPLWTAMSENWMGNAVRNGYLYGIRNINMMGALTGVATTVIDTRTWKEVSMTFAEEPSFALLPSTMSYDFVTGDIYGVFYNEDLTGQNWVRYNTKTLQPEIICPFNGRFNVIAMGTAADGNIYIINTDGDLYTVNRSNSRISLVGNTGVDVAAYTQAMTWDSKTNSFLWMAITSNGAELYSLDPTVPSAVLIRQFDDMEQTAGIYFDDQEGMSGCPLAPTGIKWNFNSDGAFDGNISMTSPSAGEITVYLDGEIVKDNEKVSAGATVSIPFQALSNATHHVAAVVKNEKGYGPVGESFQYVGHDVPKAVTNVIFEEADGIATVRWDAPEGGVEDGFLDPSRLYYKVYRMPDNVEVASHNTETTFTETLPKVVKRYYYRVIPFNGDEKQGEAAVSNGIVFGESYDLPYVDDFSGDNALEAYEIIDNDGDGNSWNINPYGDVPLLACSVTFDQNIDATDDWILSPKIKFQSGKLYRVTFHARNTWPGAPDRMAVGYTDADGMTKEDVTVVKNMEVDTPSMTRLDHTADFSVAESGDYKIALGFLTPRGEGGGVFISELRVEEVGNLTAPEAVTDLCVIPDPDYLPRAVIRFTAPTKAIDSTNLDGTLTAHLYRDGNEISTKTGINPGETAEMTDDADPEPGTHTYIVRMENSHGLGNNASATAFIGIYTPPFSDGMTTREECDKYSFRTFGFEDDPMNSQMHFASYGDPCLQVDHMNFTDEHHEMWVVFPLMQIEDEKVFRISFEGNMMSWGEGLAVDVVSGDSPDPENLVEKAFDVTFDPSKYGFVEHEGLMVIAGNGGRKYVALHIVSPTQGYLYWSMRNLKIEEVASAMAPDVVTELVAESELVSRLTMKAPAVDYAGRPLDGLDKVEIYRNGSAVPSHVFDKPAPGESLEWIDKDARQGINDYLVVGSNSHGRGNALEVSSFIGYDEPIAPEGLSIVPNDDNQTATVSWNRPERGIHGGVLNQEKMSFVLVTVNPEETDPERQITILRQGLTETSVVPEREATDNQELVYYGIATVTPQGVSEPSVYFTILGRPYTVPFAESFTAGEASTGIWLNTGSAGYGLQAMPTSEDVLEYNGFTGTSQDDDNGVFMFLNGAMSENPIPFAVLSPKVSLAGSVDPVLSFWLYKGSQRGGYETVPTLEVSASSDESDFRVLGTERWDDVDTPTWVKCEYSLADFKSDRRAVIFQMVATAGGMADIMLMDNFRIDNSTSVNSVDTGDNANVIGLDGGFLTRGASGKDVRVFDLAGRLVDSFRGDDLIRRIGAGVYVVTFSGRSFKVIVK